MPVRSQSFLIPAGYRGKLVDERACRWPLDPARVLVVRRMTVGGPSQAGSVHVVLWYAVIR